MKVSNYIMQKVMGPKKLNSFLVNRKREIAGKIVVTFIELKNSKDFIATYLHRFFYTASAQ